jgi:hypothetical protein
MRTAIFVCAALLLMSVAASADVPPLMSYQGVLADADGNPVPDGYYDITFGLYTVETGGTPDWEETQTLSVEGGIINANLGSAVPLGDPLHFDVPYWLSIAIEGESELTPRTPLTTVPYAGWAVHAIESTPDDDWVVDDPYIYTNLGGGVGIGDTTPEWRLDIHDPNAANTYMQITNGTTGDAMYTGLVMGVSGSGEAWISQGSAHGLHLGHGASATSINVFPDGNASIGLISDPDDKLEVDGTVEMTGFKMPTGAVGGYVLTSDATGEGTWEPILFAQSASATGSVTLDERGEARVAVPASLSGSELHYQLTCIGSYAPVYVAEKAERGVFVIAGGEPGMEVCWQVTRAQ